MAHCASMLDTVALPVWIGALVGHYAFDPQQAGLLVTLFLGGVVLASLILAPRLHRLPKSPPRIRSCPFRAGQVRSMPAKVRRTSAAWAVGS